MNADEMNKLVDCVNKNMKTASEKRAHFNDVMGRIGHLIKPDTMLALVLSAREAAYGAYQALYDVEKCLKGIQKIEQKRSKPA